MTLRIETLAAIQLSKRKLLKASNQRICTYHFIYNEGLVLLKLADTVLILINTGPSNVNFIYLVDILLQPIIILQNKLS